MANPLIRKIGLLIAMIYIVVQSYAQTTTIKGKVTDRETGLPIPYVTIVFKNTTKGATTDTLGMYKLSTKEYVDSVQFSTVTYLSKTLFVKSGSTSVIDVALKPDTINLAEVRVVPDEGPVRQLLKEMNAHKKTNNPDKYSRYSFRKYTKWEYHLNHVSDNMIQSKAFRNNQSVFKTNSDSTKFLPLYFSEQIVYNEFQRNPLKQKSTILADRTTGVGVLDKYEISGYTSGLDMEVNFYDNYIYLFTQNFVSPLAENGWFYYKYFLADSSVVNGQQQYRINFFPRRMGDNVFKGYLITETKNYSLLEIDGTLVSTANLNFLKSLRLKGGFQMVADSIPFYRRNQIEAVFDYVPGSNNPSKKPISLYYTQSSVIDSVTVNHSEDVSLSYKAGKYETVKAPEAAERDENYWNAQRLEELNERERGVEATIDSVNTIKSVNFANNVAQMVVTGFYDFGKFEFGPYGNIFSINKVEGFRMFAGLRTSDEISKRYMIWAGLGYGTLNKKVNGAAGFGYKFPSSNRQIVKLSFDDKIIRSGENEKILYLYENLLSPTENNIVSQVFRRDELDELFREQKVASSYEYEWHPGLLNKISANYTTHFSPQFYPFMRAGMPIDRVSAFDLNVETRLSWKEKMIDDKFMRIYQSTDYPVIHLSVGGGQVFYSGQTNYYGKVLGTIHQRLMVGLATLNYAIEGGYYIGKLPYTMLDIPRGNETIGLYIYDFNLLNYMEYIHDKYLHAYLEYHLNGFVFNRMPLLKSSGLREVISAKSIVGSLSNKHQEIVEFPLTMVNMKHPYLEIGAGVENLFRFFRVEGIWRVGPESVQGAPKFGVRIKLEVKL